MVASLFKDKSRRSYKRQTAGAARLRFAVICLLAFLARYSVVVAHDCDRVNIFSEFSGRDVSTANRVHHAGHTSGSATAELSAKCEDGKNHEHETCPVCQKFEKLQKDGFFFHNFSIIVLPQNAFISVITTPGSVIFVGRKYTPLPRAPPLV